MEIEPHSIEPDHTLIDVRTPSEFKAKKIENSVNVPLDEVDRRLNEIADKTNIVLICASGHRAKRAQQALAAQGISARILRDGIKGWAAKGFQLQSSGGGMISLDRQVRIVAGGLAAAGGLLAILVDPNWGALSAFVGAGLVFAGVTDTCAMAMMFAKLPFNRR